MHSEIPTNGQAPESTHLLQIKREKLKWTSTTGLCCVSEDAPYLQLASPLQTDPNFGTLHWPWYTML